jgi:GT2 family glycosyltransferase
MTIQRLLIITFPLGFFILVVRIDSHHFYFIETYFKNSMNPRVSLITVNYNQTKVTCDLLDSIRRQDYKNVEVIVVDNASNENPVHLIGNQYPEVIFIRSEQNLGFAGGNNLALPVATGDFLFFINNDTELINGCIGSLVDLFAKNNAIGAASPLICYFPEKNQTQDTIQYVGMTQVNAVTARNTTLGYLESDKGQYKEALPTAYAHGAAMMMRADILEKAGIMASDFFLYYEELDWCERIRKAGFEIWVEPKAKIYHKESLTVSKMGALKTYFLNRNRVYFMRRNFGGVNLLLFYVFLFCITVPKNVLLYSLKRDWKNLSAFLRGIWWNFSPSINEFEKLTPTHTSVAPPLSVMA